MRNNFKTTEDLAQFVAQCFAGAVTDQEIESFLTAIASRKINEQDLTALARLMLQHAKKIDFKSELLLDTCGTGGDQSHSFNLSTAAALLVASFGVKVAKHGNRALTSQSGSADLLEALRIPIQLNPLAAAQVLKEEGFVFLFAPLYHGATAQVQKVRRQLKIRTIFNLLGPLTNPAPITHQLVGIYDQALLMPVAKTLQALRRKRAWVVWGEGNLDEVSLLGKTFVAEVTPKKIREFSFTVEDAGLKPALASDLRGDTAQKNADRLEKIFQGQEQDTPLVNAIALNVAAALMVVGKVEDLKSGVRLAKTQMASGLAFEYLNKIRQSN
ncbi:MAG: anthranilate phosphoribosyltransferase [Deltaproteobacteria bacterium]|nr:anthranilate phosphoribosyltransferase [Deltaproteobacteria bacterium]